jgi:hypothetical protein
MGFECRFFRSGLVASGGFLDELGRLAWYLVPAGILGQHPFDHPARSKRSPAPRFHAMRKTIRTELYQMYAWFVAAYRTASEKLRSGNRLVAFPTGSFPPALPFAAG